MSPLRILILAALVYLAFRLIFGGRRRNIQKSHVSGGTGHTGEPVKDILVEDTVCGRLVPKTQAVVFERQGKMYYFCSRKCCDTFRTKQGES